MDDGIVVVVVGIIHIYIHLVHKEHVVGNDVEEVNDILSQITYYLLLTKLSKALYSSIGVMFASPCLGE